MTKKQIMYYVYRHNDRVGTFPFAKFERVEDCNGYEVYKADNGTVHYNPRTNKVYLIRAE